MKLYSGCIGLSLIKELLQRVMAMDLSTKDVKLKIMKLFNLSEEEATKLLIRAKSELRKQQVKQARKKIVLLPQCLRNQKCKAPLTEEGFACNGCELDCKIKKIKEFTSLPSYILPGGSMVAKIVAKEKPGAVIGIACFKEVDLGMSECEKIGLPSVGVTLLKDGCVNTLVDFNEVKQLLEEVDATGKKRR